jgi:hypothetical protein
MTVKIRVQNYQSIEDSEIEVSGLTIITGSNNRGKSALHRAVFGAFTNAKGTKFVRHGKEKAVVTLKFDDGHTLVWEKGEKVNSYTVDGKTLNKVGAGAPPLEVQSLRVLPIEASGREFWPQFAHQFTGQVFLLNEPGSVLAESIADVARVGVLNEALRSTQSEKRSLVAEVKVRNADLAKLEAQESTYAGLDAVGGIMASAEALDLLVTECEEQLASVTALRDGIESFTDAVGEFIPVRWVEMPTGVEALQADLLELEVLRTLSAKISEAHAVHDQLSPVAGIEFPDEASVTRAQKMVDVIHLIRGLRNQMAPLRELVQEGQGIREALTLPVLDEAVPLEPLRELEECRQLQRDLVRCQTMIRDITEESGTLTKEFDLASHTVMDLLGGVGDCPICGRS